MNVMAVVTYLRALYVGAYYRELRETMDALLNGTALPPVPFGIDAALRDAIFGAGPGG